MIYLDLLAHRLAITDSLFLRASSGGCSCSIQWESRSGERRPEWRLGGCRISHHNGRWPLRRRLPHSREYAAPAAACSLVTDGKSTPAELQRVEQGESFCLSDQWEHVNEETKYTKFVLCFSLYIIYIYLILIPSLNKSIPVQLFLCLTEFIEKIVDICDTKCVQYGDKCYGLSNHINLTS